MIVWRLVKAVASACLAAPLLIWGVSSAQPAPPSPDFPKAMEAYHKLPDTAGTVMPCTAR